MSNEKLTEEIADIVSSKSEYKQIVAWWNPIPIDSSGKSSKIPYFKKLKRYPQVKNSLRFVQKLRNAVAHWELDEKMSNKNEIIICNPVTFERVKLDDKLMEEFKEHEKFLLKIFGWEQTLTEKYGIRNKK